MAKKRDFKLNKEQQKLVVSVMSYAAGLAKRYKSTPMGSADLDDLTQIALLGFCAAAKDFDETRGVKFSSYAWNRGQAYIQHFLRDKSRTIKVPRQLTLDYYKYSREVEQGGEPSFSGDYLELIKGVGYLTPQNLYEEVYSYEAKDEEYESLSTFLSEDELHLLQVWFNGHQMTKQQSEEIDELIARVRKHYGK